MPLSCVVGGRMSGSVPHHAGHAVGYTEYGPIYCSGHSVTGTVTKPNQGKLFIQGKAALVIGGGGPSTDACDGSEFIAISGSSSLFIQGKPIVREGDGVALYPGSGTIVFANESKHFVRR